MKREYIQPAMLAVKLQHRTDILTISSVSTSGLNSSDDLQYDEEGRPCVTSSRHIQKRFIIS